MSTKKKSSPKPASAAAPPETTPRSLEELPPPRYTPQVAEHLVRKLQKRGFITDGVREHCPRCKLSAVTIYRIAGRIGGRDIFWCQACGDIRSVRRAANDALTTEPDFDLEAFLK